MPKRKILLVEDDEDLAMVLKDFFEENGLKIYHTTDGALAFDLYKKEQPALVLLDIELPGKNGLEITEQIRQKDSITPIILMSGSILDTASKVKGYQLGAINYVSKPLDPIVLLAQIQNQIKTISLEKEYYIHPYSIVIHGQLLQINNDSIQLRERDMLALCIFLENINNNVSKEELSKIIWKDYNYQNDNMLNGIISRLRKILQPYKRLFIHTIYSSGYSLKNN